MATDDDTFDDTPATIGWLLDALPPVWASGLTAAIVLVDGGFLASSVGAVAYFGHATVAFGVPSLAGLLWFGRGDSLDSRLFSAVIHGGVGLLAYVLLSGVAAAVVAGAV